MLVEKKTAFRRRNSQKKPTFEQIYEENFSYIYNYVYMMLLNRADAEDLVSEVFLKALSHYEEYDETIASAKTWLARIARNQVTDHFRYRGRHHSDSLDDETKNIEPSYQDEYSLQQDDIKQEVCRILRQLSEEERDLLNMRYFLEMGNEEIGKTLGIAPKAVSERYRRLLKKCRSLEADKKLEDFL